MDFTEDDIQDLKHRLEESVVKSMDRGLHQSSKWAAEMLNSLMPVHGDSDADADADSSMETEPTPPPVNPYLGQEDPVEAALEAQEFPKYLLAKTFFETREYDRCAAVFLPRKLPKSLNVNQNSTPKKTISKGKGQSPLIQDSKRKNLYPNLSQKSLFLALYAKYLAGEKRKDEETEMVLGPADVAPVNKALPELIRGLEGWMNDRSAMGLEDQGQGWLEYLYAIVLLKGKGRNEDIAKMWLVRSVHRNPFHWGAWQELNGLLSCSDDLKQISPALPEQIMTLIFHVYCSQELYQANDDTYSLISQLQVMFPTSAFLKTQEAMLHYHSKGQTSNNNPNDFRSLTILAEYDQASQIFHEMVTEEPHRLDNLDHYSNILYVLGARPQLAYLAQISTDTDKFRPETCCIVGNLFSNKSDHEKAIVYFRRALTLDRNFLSAWTLMGHEYIELKNTHTAIECYRRAVDCNRKDYRAWYGLGQAYEFLDMSNYALFYYKKSSTLQPYDPKMWQALGSCWAKMGNLERSIQALKRAVTAGTYYVDDESQNPGASPNGPGARRMLDPETLYQIAHLYDRLGNIDETVSYMELTILQETGGALVSDEDKSDDGDWSSVSENEADNSGDESDGAPSGSHHRGRSHKPRDGTSSSAQNNDTLGETVRHGTGPTPTTSKARLWLAQYALKNEDLARAEQLVKELCQDGMEVEDAKAIMRDIRARKEAAAGAV
ncbi:Anaphase-promoting complex subunit 8 [Penicillium taxi]|uniref:Anaphase-promoting complex subunit 8 n=1 Tax=Penicillium taxi TaxID=168475 RepID=UPI002545678A|nr:Anaphase-promoting complex subunit 8 [Penicillium taxi]KAJ5908643.1 Anaphase-promoting complex subunit 8 [Penicillium taxi]